MMEPTMIGPWLSSIYQNVGRTKREMRLLEKFEIVSDNKIEIEVREGAKWSDGKQLTAEDAVGSILHRILKPKDKDPSAVKPPSLPSGVEFPNGKDGRKVNLLQYKGGFSDEYWAKETIWQMLGVWRGLCKVPTHIEPYRSMMDYAWDHLEDTDWTSYTGEEDNLPTYDVNVLVEAIDDPAVLSRKMRDPEVLVTNGAWTLSEIRGSQEIVLEPNEHWRNADEVNFDKVIFEYMPEDQRTRASIQSDNVDFAQLNLRTDEIEGLPGSYKQKTLPSNGGGYSLEWDHSHPAFGQREVRQAVQYALNTKQIAKNVHETLKEPIMTPGGDAFAIDAVVDDSWINNLQKYPQNTDKAASLMEEAGCSKQGGTWVDPEGNEMSFELPTANETTRTEQTVASQLSDFGINLQVQPYDAATYDEKWLNEEFTVFQSGSNIGTGFFTNISSSISKTAAKGAWFRTRNWWSEDKIEDAISKYGFQGEDSAWVAGDYTAFEDLTVEMPPIGQPDGDLEEWQVLYELWQGGKAADTLERHKKAFWFTNWWMPGNPLYNGTNLHIHDRTHWLYPTEHFMWPYYGVSIDNSRMLSMNMINADPENPEEGASVSG
jgi:ABC-type transport system substrate-binding protein